MRWTMFAPLVFFPPLFIVCFGRHFTNNSPFYRSIFSTENRDSFLCISFLPIVKIQYKQNSTFLLCLKWQLIFLTPDWVTLRSLTFVRNTFINFLNWNIKGKRLGNIGKRKFWLQKKIKGSEVGIYYYFREKHKKKDPFFQSLIYLFVGSFLPAIRITCCD